MNELHNTVKPISNASFTSTATTFTGGEASPTIFSLNYDFHVGAGDNGNVWAITNNKDSSRSQSFTAACPRGERSEPKESLGQSGVEDRD